MHKQDQSGFTMVEILVALVVSSMLVFVMTSVLENGFQINGKTEKRANASALAFKKVQDYINLEFETIPIGDFVDDYEVEDFSAEADELDINNAVAKVFIESKSVLDTTGSSSTPSIYVDEDGDGEVDNPTLVKVTATISYEAYQAKQSVVYSTFIRRFGVGN